ncbi:glycosyltransferase family 2 protein [Synechococcus sp. M16.1]|uniref:glycosyltransferase family 2 protein n=1 Tax=Synechococcus sp. M16.1 TaxID=1442553 RepID=UPI00185FBDC1|nr:glycosyltransferase family 2 protein [Synechococcus sp. M16.1]QNJ10254.1 glycosyltransferase domain protein [Synechococcus sp. M16.1]
MKTRSSLLWISLSLDVVGLVLAALLATQFLHHSPALVLSADGMAFGLGFVLLAWFFGGYSFLRWPWMPFRHLVQRWLLVVGSALLLAVLAGWLLNVPVTAVWFHRSTLLILGLALGCWGVLMRCWLHPLARRQAALASARSPVAQQMSRADLSVPQASATAQRQLLLLLVAYHPSPLEVEQLQDCLAKLPPEVGYAVVVNDHQPGEPVNQLAAAADLFLANPDNPGYGRAVNRLVVSLGPLPPYIGVLNTDLSWEPGSFEQLLAWLQRHPQVSLAVPQILDEQGTPQKLCKHHPTVLGLFSRRFLPNGLKPGWLKRYDRWYVMADQNYEEVFEAPYLSGCCMLIRSEAFRRAGGFDERYFLYLEDADLTRSLARDGRCVHLPVASVVHGWGRGNYRNLGLMAVNLTSAWHYFRKWGWALW